MQLNPSSKSYSFSANQEIPPHFTKPEGSFPLSQVPANCPYSEPRYTRLLFEKSVLISIFVNFKVCTTWWWPLCPKHV